MSLPEQQTLFPCRDNLNEVEEEAKAMLPITDVNQLLSVLRIHENTLLKLFSEATCKRTS